MSQVRQGGRAWLRFVLVAALCAGAVVAAGQIARPPLATALVVAFVTLAPGLGFVGLLEVRDGWHELALAIGLALAIDVLVVIAFEYARDGEAWHPLAVLIGISLAGALAQLVVHRLGHRREESTP